MSIKPVFMLLVCVRAGRSGGSDKRIKIFIPIPIYWLGALVESLADLASFINIITFGAVKLHMGKGPHPFSLAFSYIVKIMYTLSDFLTELLFHTGRFDIVDIDAKDENDPVKVKISVI